MNQNTAFNDVAVIMINYNSSDYSLNCINSIIKNTTSKLKYQIIIIDNASELEDYNHLSEGISLLKNKADIYLFRSRINLGFSGGNMLGVQFASAKYYFFLNNDCELQNDCLSILKTFCDNNIDVALCSPQLYLENKTHQPCIDYFPTLSTKLLGVGILKPFYGKRYFKRKKLYDKPTQVDIISGSQMFANAEIFNLIGGLDLIFFLYCEEEDISLRMHNAGYKTYLVPMARNIHAGGGSTTDSLAIKKEFYISFLYFYRKHYGFIKTNILKLLIALRLVKKGFKDTDNFKISLFVLTGAHMKYSLRHKQKISPNSSSL